MRVVIYTPGSRGGVQSYLAPGGLLDAADHDVNVATRSTFASKVREKNLGLSPSSDDPSMVVAEDEGGRVMTETGKYPGVSVGRFVELWL